MADYYTIHFYSQESRCPGEDLLKSYVLYPTFDNAVKALDEVIKREIDCYNLRIAEKLEFRPPTKKELQEDEERIKHRRFLNYYEMENGYMFVIRKMSVMEEKKKYVYQYWVENKTSGIHTKSDKYASFDEACDALDKELRERNGGSYWEPRMSRDEFRPYMGDGIAATYDFFKEDKYVLVRMEA